MKKMDFHSMKRKELQTLCKKNGIPANLSNVEMATRLAAIQKVKQQKMFKSCLKNLETGISSDDESDMLKIKGRKRVKFSPENETFEFEKTDPRELRLLARKRRSMAKSELGKNPVLVSAGNLVAECEEVGSVDETVGRNLRGKSMVESSAVFVSQDVSNVAKHVEKENQGRSLRSCSRKAEHKNVETALSSLCVDKKVKRGKKGDEIIKGGVVDRADRLSDKIADHIGNTHMVTRRSLRSGGLTADNLAKSAAAAGVLERSKLIEKDLNRKGANILQVPRRSVRHAKTAKGGDLTSVSEGRGDDKSSDRDGAKNHTENHVETALDSRKRRRAGNNAANRKHQSFEEVSQGYVDQQNGNVEKPVDARAFVGRRLRSTEGVIEGLGKGEVGEFQVFPEECLMRKCIQRKAKNDENDESSIPAQTARRSTRQTGKVKVDASLSAQVADDAPQSVDDISRSDNQGAQLAHEASEAIDSIMEKTDAVKDDGSFSEQSIPGGVGQDQSIVEMTNKTVDGQYHTTLGSALNVQEKEEFDRDIQVCTNSPKQVCLAYDTRRPEDCIGSNDSDEKAPANVGADTCSVARSDGPVLPLFQKNSDCEAKCSAQVNNNLVGPVKLHVAAVDDFQGGIISTPASISARKFSVSLAAENFADVSEPVFHSHAMPATPGEREVFNADCELSSSVTDLGDRKMGSEKVASNRMDRLFNHSRHEKLSRQINRLEESSFLNEENKSENAIKNQMLDHPAAVAHNIDKEVVDQEEATGVRERCDRVSRKTECTTCEVFGGQGLSQSVSQKKGLVGGEANSEANAEHYSTLDRSNLSVEALLATIGELTEEGEESKTVTPLHNRVAGTSSRRTEECKMDASENKDGCEDMSLFSIVGNNLYLQSQVEGDFTAALGLPKKAEESYKETLGGLAGFQDRGKQNNRVQNDEVTSVKQLEAADGFAHHLLLSIVFKDDVTNPCENKELESEKAAVVSNSDKDVDSATNESSQCLSAVSGKTKYFEQSSGKVVEGDEADTSPCWNESRNPVQGQDREPLQANWASYSRNLISGSDVKNARSEVSEWTSVTKRVILVEMPEISVRHDDNTANLRSRASTVPSGIMEEEVRTISQVQDTSSLIETEETSQSSEILHDSFTAQECYELECTVENVDVFPCKSAEVNKSVSKLFTNDMHNASENPGEGKLVEAASISRAGREGLCSIPFSVLNQEPEAKDSVFPLPLKPQPLVGNAKVTNEIEDPIEDGSEVRCFPSLDDCAGTNNVNVSPKETNHGEVNNSEGPCITKSPGNRNLQKLPSVFTEVSDAIDPGTCNSEEVEFARDQGNTKRGPQNVNGELLGSHVHNVHEAAILIANDHVASERLDDLQRSTFGLDGIHFALGHVEHEENGSPACGSDIEELRTGESLCPEDHDDKGNELDSAGIKLIALASKLTSADEKTLEASMNDMHVMPGDAGDRNLFEATNIREMGYHVICSSPSSPINGDTHYVHVKGDHDADKAEAQDIVCPAVLEPLSFAGTENPIDEIEGALRDASEFGCAPLLDDSLGTTKDNIDLKESELGEVKSSENACMTSSDDSASERRLHSSSCGRADVSDVVIDHGRMNTSEEVEADVEINYKHVKSNCNADQPVTCDVFYRAVFESQSFGGNEKTIDQTGRALHDASEYGCALLLVDSQGTGKDNIAPKESELCEVRNPEDACITSSDRLASERQKDLLRSSGSMTGVSDVVMDHDKMDNSEVDANRDQGNSRIGEQNMNGGHLDVLLQEKASATATDHSAFKVSEDSRSSPCAHDGICSVQHSDYKENGCLAKIEEQPLCLAVIDHHDAEGVAVNSVTVDEKALQVLKNSIHGTTANFSEKELVEAATIREMGCRDLHSSPFSIISWEANIEGACCDADQAGTTEILYPAMVELEPQFSGGYEKETKKIEEASEDTSAFRSSPSIGGTAGTGKLDVVLKESQHGEVHSLEDACLIGSDDLASEKPEDLRTAPCEIAEVSDVTKHGKSNSSEVVSGADQVLNSSYELELDQHMLLKDDESMEGHNVVCVESVVEMVPPPSLSINSRNSEAVGDMRSNPGSPGGHKLSDVTEVNEMAQKAVSNYPCSMPNPETSHESFKGNSEPALEKLEEDSTSISMHHHPFFKMLENGEVLFDDLEDRCLNMVDPSVAESCSVVKSKEGEHANPVESAEMCHIAVEHFSNPCGKGTENILGGKDNNDDNSNKTGTFSPSPCAFDNVTGAVQAQNASPSVSGSQRPGPAESVSAAWAGNTALHDQMCSVESGMFSSSEIDVIWRNMIEYNNSGNMQQPVTEQTVSGKELADGHLSSSTHCKPEDMDGRNSTEHEVADDQTVNQEIQLAKDQVIELKLLSNPSRENPDYTSGNMNETGRTDKHPNCPHNAKNSGEIPQNAKDFHAIDHADGKVTKSSLIKRKNSRSILIHGTPQKPPLFIHDLKENTQAPKARQMLDVTAIKPMLKRKALEDLHK